MGFAEGLTNLGEDLAASFDARVNFLGQNIVDVQECAADAHKFLGGLQKDHKAMGRKLRTELGHFVGDLQSTVGGLLDRSGKDQERVRRDLKTMGKKVRADLGAFTGSLTETVEEMRNQFQKEQKAVHQECKGAHQSWQKGNKAMVSKRHNFRSSLKKAQQKAK